MGWWGDRKADAIAAHGARLDALERALVAERQRADALARRLAAMEQRARQGGVGDGRRWGLDPDIETLDTH
jgi:hypothetical protein